MVDRRRRGPDAHLQLKLGAFFLAAVLLLAGMWAGMDWLVLVGIVVAAGAWLLRFARRKHDAEDGPPVDE